MPPRRGVVEQGFFPQASTVNAVPVSSVEQRGRKRRGVGGWGGRCWQGKEGACLLFFSASTMKERHTSNTGVFGQS
jgi:hypothetical protein